MGKGGEPCIPFITRAGKDDVKDGSVGEAFEFLLAEWHLPPDYILGNWTDEMLELMVEKLVERKKRETEAISGRPSGRVVSDDQFFREAGIKVVKRD